MTITEVTDYSIVVMKDSEDKPWLSISEMVERANLSRVSTVVPKEESISGYYTDAAHIKDIIGSGNTAILYLDKIRPSNLAKGVKVVLLIGSIITGTTPYGK